MKRPDCLTKTVLAAVVGLFVAVAPALAGITERVSVGSTGQQGNQYSGYGYPGSVSANGRFVAFGSYANNLVEADTNEADDVFVRDRLTGITVRVSMGSSGEQGNHSSFVQSAHAMSADGSLVVFYSEATNLVAGDTNGHGDVFVRNWLEGWTQRVSVSGTGEQANASSGNSSVSADGRFVAFGSGATNLVPGDTNNIGDLFVRDLSAGTTERVSVSSSGAQIQTWGPQEPSLSGDGRFVVFSCSDSGLVPGDTNGKCDVFVHDRSTGITERVSVSSSSEQGNGDSYWPSISGDGRYVAFASNAGNLVGAGQQHQFQDIFVRDRLAHSTNRVTYDPSGGAGRPAVSLDGRFVAFYSGQRSLVPGDTNEKRDVFIYKQSSGRIEIVSVSSAGAPGNWHSERPAISADGRFVVFTSEASNLVPGDTNGKCDVFMRDRLPPPPSNLSISVDGGAACTESPNVTLSLAATDAHEMRFRNQSGAWSAWEPYATAKSWILSAGRGTKTVGFQCRDTYGSLSEEVTDTIRVPTFDDVGCSSPQWACVEAVVSEGIACGCWQVPRLYCPGGNVNRAQMAKFLCIATAKTPLNRVQPTFADVPNAHWAYGYIERLADAASWNGVPPTGGCRTEGATKYFCPYDPVTREQMSKFLCMAAGRQEYLKSPPTFADVPITHPFYRWIERLADPGSWPNGIAVTAGCAAGQPRLYCPRSSVTRGQMAVFLVKAFGIPR
jgi:Tol biopolymer transport system component